MEKVVLNVNERVEKINNLFGERFIDYIQEDKFVFEAGKIYGIINEVGGGGEIISNLLTNNIVYEKERIYLDDIEIKPSNIQDKGWYVGKAIYSTSVLKKEISVKQVLINAIKEHKRYENIDGIIEEFHISKEKMNYGVSRYGYERWRVSLAIGYAKRKEIYCFPQMNSGRFYDCMINSAVYSFFRKIRDEGAIIILPTTREENVRNLADEIIDIRNPRFNKAVCDHKFFKEFF